MDERIVYADSLVDISKLIKRDFASRLPVSVRGILTSIGPSFFFPQFVTERDLPTFIKSIDRVLEDGTELDRVRENNFTRVDVYPKESGSWAFMFSRYSQEAIEKYAALFGFSSAKKGFLRHAVLVYDDRLLINAGVFTSQYRVKLPLEKEVAKRLILKAYVNMGEDN